jgi:hypothetical protein
MQAAATTPSPNADCLNMVQRSPDRTQVVRDRNPQMRVMWGSQDRNRFSATQGRDFHAPFFALTE